MSIRACLAPRDGRFGFGLLGWRAAVTDGGAEEAVRPFLGEPARASENHRHIRVACRESSQHVSQPGTASGLSSEEVGILTLDHDGRAWVLETRVSHSAKKTMSPGRWKAILRDQLQVSEEDFWQALRSKEPVQRPSAPPAEGEIQQVPAWAAAVLSSRLKMSLAEITALGRDRAIQLAYETWSKPSE